MANAVPRSTINIDDLHIAEGTMLGGLPVSPSAGPSKPVIPGTDLAGVIDQVGVGVKHLAVGQRVYGITNPMKGRGPWAELCCVPAKSVRAMPSDWSFEAAATLGLSGAVLLRPEGRFVTVVGPERFVGETDLGVLGASWIFARVGARMVRSRLSRSRPTYSFAGPTTPDFDRIEQWIIAPGIRPLIDRILPLAVGPTSEGIAYVRSHRAVGKVVIRVEPSE